MKRKTKKKLWWERPYNKHDKYQAKGIKEVWLALREMFPELRASVQD